MIKLTVFQFPRRKTDQPLNCVSQSLVLVNIKLKMNGYRDTHQANNKTADESIPCSKRPKGRHKWQSLAINSLNLHAGVEPSVGVADAKPG